jgi:hypothetical protein
MIDMNNPTIRTFLERGYGVSVQLHVKPGGPPKYTAMARHLTTGKHVQGWGPSAAEAVDDLRRRAGILGDSGAN